ncbi:MAG: BspA family leucine-rich repeat surface protein [Ruminococcus sp.]|nr:BspA family leucine-rich repeat surface protein [Ruminococcus sp.]MBR2284619.1 BspA family leucine-rich repeat surface protein [Ruminococcus sp.]
MRTLKQRIAAGLFAVIFMLNLLDGNVLSESWRLLKAFAAAIDYTGYFEWDISELETPPVDGSSSKNDPSILITDKDGKNVREVSLANGVDLSLKEYTNEDPVLKTTFYFNLKQGVNAGNLEFTITGMSDLVRKGDLKLNDTDPNLVKTWDIIPNEDGSYTFRNKVRVTSNNETTFTWQFNSRDAINDTDITLETSCKIWEEELDPETGKLNRIELPIELDTNDLTFHYESEHDQNQVLIVCEHIDDLDVNNLNVDYDWRSYRAVLGLEGLDEYTKRKESNGVIIDPSDDSIDSDFEAHAIVQDKAEQTDSQMARGIKTADHFIEVTKPDGIDWSDMLIVNANGDRVPIVQTTITTESGTQTLWGFYDFQRGGDRKPGEAYSCVYRVGVLNEKLNDNPIEVRLTSHYLVTYQDTTAPIDLTDSAAHYVKIENPPSIGDGDWMNKYNNYEINNGTTYNDIQYASHAKHYAGANQLLYDSVFNGRVVTYSLTASTRQAKYDDGKSLDEHGNARLYDLIYEDGAPAIQNLSGADDRTLRYDEYDFTRIRIGKLVDGNTVGVPDPDSPTGYAPESGFDYVVYGISHDPESPYYDSWSVLSNPDTANTLTETEVLLPAGIDEIKLVVKDLAIRAYIRAYVDIQYNLDPDLRSHMYIDTLEEHDFELDEKGNKVRKEDTNEGTRLVNTFRRIQYADGNYDPSSIDNAKYQNLSEAHSNTWLRESTTTIDSHTAIEPFQFHSLSEEELKEHDNIPLDYYSTVISAGGTIQSDSESSLNHFAVYSKLPDGVTPSDEWLEEFKNSLVVNAVLQGSNEPVDAQFMLDNNAVTVYYDPATKCVVADFDCQGFSLRADQMVSVDFSYPAEISLAKVKAYGLTQVPFKTETYITVLDSNVKLDAVQGKTLVEFNDTPYQNTGVTSRASKSEADTKITAMGSQKNNYSTKYVASFYNDWTFDNDTEVDGNNTHHLEDGKMTSEYTYALAFHRITTDNETVKDPIMVDIMEGLTSSAWNGRVKKIYFDADSYPADSNYQPHVYYMLGQGNSAVRSQASGDYRETNDTIMEAISHFQQYGNETDVSGMSEQYATDLASYNSLKGKIKNGDDGWTSAVQNTDGSWTIDRDDVYAVAVIFDGTYTVTNKYLELGAYIDMSAPALENNTDIDRIINNRATYNEVHVFAEGVPSGSDVSFPMYSVSNKTLVILRHNVELEKVSSKNNGRRLSGAKFTIFSNSNSFENDPSNESIAHYYTFDKRRNKNESHQMIDMPVDITGILQLNLSPGIYYYKETEPPAGYKEDPKPYRFRVTADTDSVYYYTAKLYESTAQRDAEYIAVNSEEFGLYPEIYGTKIPIDDSLMLAVFDTDGTAVTHFRIGTDAADAGKYVYDTLDPDATISEVHCTDGEITLKNLPAGTYMLGKTASDSDGYVFSVADNSEITLNLIKKSPMSMELVYKLYEKSGSGIAANDQPCYFTKTADGTYVLTNAQTGNTDIEPAADGKINLSGLDDTKSYYFEIAEAPVGYKAAHGSVYDIKGQSSVELYAAEHLEKKNRIVVEDDPIEIASAKFQKIDGTDSVNYGNPINGAVYNMYFIEEDGSESLMYFQYNSEKKNYIYMGTTPIQGYTNQLRSAVSTDNADGMISVSGLPYGTYFMQEVTAPLGYQLDPTKHYFRVTAVTIDKNGNLIFSSDEETDAGTADEEAAADTESDTETEGESTEAASTDSLIMQLKDDEILSKIIVNKTEEKNTDNYLKNATYDLYRLNAGEDLQEAKDASVNSKGNTVSAEFTKYWTHVDTSYTDSTGEALFENLPFGTYLLYEQQPPVGYKWNNDIGKWETWTLKDTEHTKNSQVIILSEETVSANSSVSYEIVTDEDGNEETVRVVTYHEFFAKHLDERKEGQARLIKQNETHDALYDGVFALYQVNPTNAEIARILGKTVEEVNAMSDSEKLRALSKKELTVKDIDIANHFDLASGKPKTTGTPAVTIDTAIDQNLKTNGEPSKPGATKTLSGLDWGIYYFYEVKAPAGYQKNSTPYVFAVNSGSVGTLIEVDATDAKTYGEVWLYKQAKDKIAGTEEHLKLFGAQFALNTGEDVPVQAIPKLRLSGLEIDGTRRNRVLLPVKSVEVRDKTHIRFQLRNLDGDGFTHVIAAYDESKDGNVVSLTAEEDFRAKYNTEAALGTSDFRLSYYVISADGTQYYDDDLKRYVPFAEEPEVPDTDGLSQEDADELTAKYQEALAAYQADERLKECITGTYITADAGGRLNVRGLDWKAYYFRETVPPEGYGLADDVLFTVNPYNCDNQFLPCEDPKAEAAIIIDKEIPDASYFEAYGDPTFLFKVYGLEAFTEEDTTTDRTPDYITNGTNYKKTGKEYTLSIHLTAPNTTGSAMLNVQEGQYLIEELPVSRYSCYGLSMVSGTDGEDDKFKIVGIQTPTSYKIYHDSTKYDINTAAGNGQWTAFCDLTGGDTLFAEILAFHIKYQNEIERYDNFSHVSYADNRIPERIYITSFKPMYTSLIEVYSGTDDSHEYEIDLGAALASGDFEGILTYNNGETKRLTVDDLAKLRFKTTDLGSSIASVVWNPTTKVLRVTVNDPATWAGAAISLDVGYSDVTPFDAYDTQNVNMVSGKLALTFSEIKANRVKKLILKNDVGNKSYFPYADPTNMVQDITSVAVLYTRDAESGLISNPTMQDDELTDTLKVINSDFEFKYWYLLDENGKPVFDSEGNVIQFKRDSDPTKDEIVQYMFSGTWPSYLFANGKNLLPASLANPADVENLSTFTFQAEVDFVDHPTSVLMSKADLREALISLVDNKDQILAIKERVRNEPYSYYKKTVISADDPNYTTVTWAYSIPNGSGYDIVFRTEDNTDPLLIGDQSGLFENFTNLIDITGMESLNTYDDTFDPDTYSLKKMPRMFANTKISRFDLTHWNVSKVTTFVSVFQDVAVNFTVNISGWDITGSSPAGSNEFAHNDGRLFVKDLTGTGNARGRLIGLDISGMRVHNSIVKITFSGITNIRNNYDISGITNVNGDTVILGVET